MPHKRERPGGGRGGAVGWRDQRNEGTIPLISYHWPLLPSEEHTDQISQISQSSQAANRVGKVSVGAAAACEPLAVAPRQRPFSSSTPLCLWDSRAAVHGQGPERKASHFFSKRGRAPPKADQANAVKRRMLVGCRVDDRIQSFCSMAAQPHVL